LGRACQSAVAPTKNRSIGSGQECAANQNRRELLVSAARLRSMVHRGFQYDIRRFADEWVWTVYIPALKEGTMSGDRFFAIVRAKSVIDTLVSSAKRERPRQRGLLRGNLDFHLLNQIPHTSRHYRSRPAPDRWPPPPTGGQPLVRSRRAAHEVW
jgi:hypothetical protein